MQMDALDAINNVEESYTYYKDISSKVISTYTKDLDNCMQRLQESLLANTLSDLDLEKYVLELNSYIYFLSTTIEATGIKEDISKLQAKQVFNEAYLSNREKDSEKRNKLTVAELTALADKEAAENYVVNSLYSRIYKELKLKIDAAYDMVNSLRKIISKRMQEMSLSMYGDNISYSVAQGE